MSNKFEVLTGRDQILKRPQMWIGSMSAVQQNMFIISDDHVEQKTVEFIPAFRKLADEILDNALDALIEHCNAEGEIKVKMSDESIYVEDNGPGIPVVKHKLTASELKSLPEAEAKQLAETYIPAIAWTRLFSGSNFQDSENKTTIGSHGIGSKAAAIFSTKFVGKTDDGKKSCVVKSVNNLETSTCKINQSNGKTGTSVEFFPDFERFGIEKVEQVYKDLMHQRLLCLAITFPKIKFNFNGKRIYINDKKFLKMFSDNIEFCMFDKGFIGVFPNEHDDFNFFTFVNGMHMSRGGSHVDYAAWQIVNPIREKLSRKFKNIKPADVKNKLTLVVFLRDFANPKFDSQTKETLTNSPSEVGSYFNGAVDFERLAKQILKNDAIINPIVDIFKLKEELKAKHELKQIKKIRVKSDKYMSSTGDKKYLLLCEGLSARGGLSAALGRNGYAFFAGRGVPLNAYDANVQAISANQELKDIAAILELDLFNKDENKKIAFEKIILANDADMDGIFIASQYIGWFTRFAPNLFNEHKIARLITPLVILRDSKDKLVKYFYSLNEFKQYEAMNDLSKMKVDFKKGLGSWPKDEFIELFENYGFEFFVQDLLMDDEGRIYVDDWLNGNNAEKRKEYLRNYSFNIETM